MATMKMGILTGLCFFSFNLFGCTAMIHNLISGDRGGHVPKINLENISKIKPGKTTEEEMIRLLGIKPGAQRTYDVPLPKEYEGKIYKIDKMASYNWLKVEEIHTPKFVDYSWKEQLNLNLFLSKGIVQFYYVSHVLQDDEGKRTLGKYDALGKTVGENWPNAHCDGYYYELVSLGGPLRSSMRHCSFYEDFKAQGLLGKLFGYKPSSNYAIKSSLND